MPDLRPNKLDILDLETTGLRSGYGPLRTDVGISEWALWSGREYRGGHTDILRRALSSKLSVSEYHAQLTGGMPAWQEGYARPGDVLAGVHERHVAATFKRRPLVSESRVVSEVEKRLAAGRSVGGWNIEFDLGVLEDVARRTGHKGFIKNLNVAWSQGRVVEMSDPARGFLFDLAREGHIDLGHTAKKAKALASRVGTTPGDLARLKLQDMMEPHVGFRKLFEKHPGITYGEFKARSYAAGGLEELMGVQSFSAGLVRPQFRYVKGWRQHVLAETISPGFLANPTKTQLGQEIGKRLNLKQGEKVTAHMARDDTVLTGILHEIFSSRDPWEAMRGYGVRSREQFVVQYKSALEDDVRRGLGTYLAEQSRDAMDSSYLRKVMSGAQEMQDAAPNVARALGAPGNRFPGLVATARGTLQEVMDLGARRPKATAAVAIVGSLLMADALVPEDNKLHGRRRPDTQYDRIKGINFGGIGAAASYHLTDFGSGRSEDNAASQIRAWKLTRRMPSPHTGYSIGDAQQAQQMWYSARSQHRYRTLARSEYERKRSGALSIPGVRPNVNLGIVNLRDFRVKVTDADTVTLHRRGLLHLFDRPVSVRLAGIDAPETHPRWPFGMQPVGIESGEYLQKLIEHQETMTLLIRPGRTTYGRHIGVLSGDVHPNINLKLVSSGAAAATVAFRGDITNSKTMAKAETLAANAGLGMWSSKGWQAKRLLEMNTSERQTHTSMQNALRISRTAGMEEMVHLVQHLHGSPSEKAWEAGELDALQQVMAMRKRERMWDANTRLKRYGWSRGIRDGLSEWNIVDAGISPSDLPHANVSAFGSGWTRRGAEAVLRRVDPLRRRLIPRATPIMTPSPTKSAQTSYVRALRDRLRVSFSLVPRVGPRVSVVHRAQHIPLHPALTKAAPAVEASSAATAVGLTRSKPGQAQAYRFMGAQYSAQAAAGSPWKPLNEYQAVRGWGFPGNWQIQAWHSLRAGEMGLLTERGVSKSDAADILQRHSRDLWSTERWDTAGQAVNRVKSQGRWAGAKGILSQMRPDRAGALWQRARESLTRRGERVIGTKGLFQTARVKAFQEFGLRKMLWRETVGQGTSVMGKIGGFIEFAMEAGRGITREGPNPLTTLTPLRWKHLQKEGVLAKPSWFNRQLDRLRGPVRANRFVTQATTYAETLASRAPNLARLGRGMGALARRTFGTKFGLVMMAYQSATGASEYRNSALGFGVEAAAAAADWAVVGATFGAFSAAGAGVGQVAGAAVGGFLGSIIPGAGTAIGWGVGAAIGWGVGWLIGAATSLALSQIVGGAVRHAGSFIAAKRNAPSERPGLPMPDRQIPGMSTYGGTDKYLTAGHGIQGRPEFSGFGGGLKPLRESRAVARILSQASPDTAGAARALPPGSVTRTTSRLQPTSGLTNVVLWGGRKRITRGQSYGPVQWGERPRRPTRPANGSRMMRSAA
jgi:endonuclease YncB( thermonuclease family)